MNHTRALDAEADRRAMQYPFRRMIEHPHLSSLAFSCLLVAVAMTSLACPSNEPSDDAGSGSETTSPNTTGEESSTEASTSTGEDAGTSGNENTSAAESTGAPSCAAGFEPSTVTEISGCPLVGEGFCSEGQAHVTAGTDIEWEHDPPHSGSHYPTWSPWGEQSDVVERGYWVHNLEHGGIVLLYNCPEGCDAELAVLRQVVEQRPQLRILLTADPLLPGERFAAISWTWVERFDAPDLTTLLCFADQHENHAPEDVP